MIEQEKPKEEIPRYQKESYERDDDEKEECSKIITIEHAELILKWIDRLEITDEIKHSYEFKLIFRGFRDGFTRTPKNTYKVQKGSARFWPKISNFSGPE